MPRIFKGLLTAILLFSCGCALFEDRSRPPMVYGPREQVFYAEFDEVWRAVNLVLQPYPLRVSNMDNGTIETDLIRGDRVWESPFDVSRSISGSAYHLVIRVVKGRLDGKAATKVIIQKESQLQSDFFSEPRPTPSDGMEERTILYRIGREVQIERAIAKSQKKTSG